MLAADAHPQRVLGHTTFLGHHANHRADASRADASGQILRFV